MTAGAYLSGEGDVAAAVLHRLGEIGDRADESVPTTGFDRYRSEVAGTLQHATGGRP
jgi:hypothetical protein